MMTEETIFRTLALPEGQDWAWLPDVNVVALSDRLDCEGKIRALGEFQESWRAAHLPALESA